MDIGRVSSCDGRIVHPDIGPHRPDLSHFLPGYRALALIAFLRSEAAAERTPGIPITAAAASGLRLFAALRRD
jgi:hypothetical protein